MSSTAATCAAGTWAAIAPKLGAARGKLERGREGSRLRVLTRSKSGLKRTGSAVR